MGALQLLDTSVTQLAAQIARGERCSTEITRSYLERIERIDPQLNAFITVDAAGALATAARVDRELSAGAAAGPLAGVPLALKDLLVTEGLVTTCGSHMLRRWCPPYDGTAVQRLRAAGAVILGKTNMDEFAMGSSNEHSRFGACRNPWSLEHVPGGSSGGSAAAVAAGLCAAALGTDTGGSIRQPAALCGVVGLKPTYGRVSRYGVVAFASSLDQVGPLGRTVADCAALLEVIAGHDPRDATSLPHPVGAYRAACAQPPRGLRVGVPAEYLGAGLHPSVAQATEAALCTLRELGLQTVEISLPHTRYAVPAYYLICTAEASANLARFDGVRFGHRAESPADLQEMYARTRQEGFGAEVRRRILLGTFALSTGYYDAYYGKAQRVRTLIRRDFEEAWSRCDVIATPTTPTPAFALGERVDDPLQMYLADVFTTSVNLAGLPALSLPSGFDAPSGLPVGLQLIGPPLAEERLFSVAAALEQATGSARRHPPLAQRGGAS